MPQSLLQQLVILLLFILVSFLAGLSYPLATAESQPPSFVTLPETIVPMITLERVSEYELALHSTSGDVRFLLAGEVMVPDDERVTRITLPPVATVADVAPADSLDDAGSCVFVARSTGRVYYRGDSTEGKKIEPEKKSCFPSEGAAQAAGFSPSKSL